MKIGIDAKRIYHNSTGLGNYGRDLVRILSGQHPESSFVLYNPKPAKISTDFPDNVSERRPRGMWKYFSSAWRSKYIGGEIPGDGVELYHGLSAELPGTLTVPSIVTVHDLIFLRLPDLYKAADRRIYTWKTRKALESASHIISISEQTKSDIIEYFGTDSEKITVIHQGCNHQFRKVVTTEQMEQIREKYGLPDTFILNVGTLENRKNSLLVLVAARNMDVSIVLVGRKTAYQAVLERYILDNNMQERVFFIHDVDFNDLPAIYHLASIFCYPSRYEGFGIPILEAISCGTPVITSRGGVFSEAGGDIARYIDPDDPEEMERMILELLGDGGDLNELETAEHLHHFSDEVVGEKYWNIYNKVLNS